MKNKKFAEDAENKLDILAITKWAQEYTQKIMQVLPVEINDAQEAYALYRAFLFCMASAAWGLALPQKFIIADLDSCYKACEEKFKV